MAEYDIYNAENGHFHSGPYSKKADADKAAEQLGEGFVLRKADQPAEVEITIIEAPEQED